MKTNTWTGNSQGTYVYNIDVSVSDYTLSDISEPVNSFYILPTANGDIRADCLWGETVTIPVKAGIILPLQFKTIYSTGTTIPTNIIAVI